MACLTFKVGDVAWLHGVVGKNKLTKGKVISIVNLQDYDKEQYIIEIKTIAKPILMIRDGTMLTDDPDKELGAFRTNGK